MTVLIYVSACSVNDWLFYVVIVLFVFVYNSLVMIFFHFLSYSWYLTKFEDYPKSRKALIPFVL